MNSRFIRVLATLSSVVVLGVVVWAMVPPAHRVVFADATTQKEVRSRRVHTVADALTQAGIVLRPEDKINPGLATPLPKDALTVSIERAVPVALTVDGKTDTLYTTGHTVKEALAEFKVTLGELDRTEPDLSAAIASGAKVRVVRVRQERTTTAEAIPYDSVRHPDDSLDEGVTRVVQAGAEGRKEIERLIVYEDGKPTVTKVLGERVSIEPRTEIVGFGTLGVVSRGGQNFRYLRKLTMTASSYSVDEIGGNGITATGVPARRGIVAVDPRVIPLGSRLYVEGYGPGLAADTGGAIKGNRIDLCVDNAQQASDYGLQDVEVYLLQD